MRGKAVTLLFAAFTAPAVPAAGDTVYLVNGNKFEQVAAERTPGGVRLVMPSGEIVLPEKMVQRVESSRSAWQVYDQRAAALRDSRAAAVDWLELAHWADDAGYAEGMRQAALRAAELDPAVAGLAPLMARLGRLREPETGEWLAEATVMRRRGYLQWGDHWLPREEYSTRLEAQRQAEGQRREDARQERIARAIEALVVAQLSRAAEPEPEPPASQRRGPLVAVYAGSFVPFAASLGAVPEAAREDQATFDDLVGRQPGSLFPIKPRRRLSSRD